MSVQAVEALFSEAALCQPARLTSSFRANAARPEVYFAGGQREAPWSPPVRYVLGLRGRLESEPAQRLEDSML